MHDPVSFTLAVLALLVTPGPTNTLLAASGAIAGLARSMRLIPAELCGYLAAIATLLFIADPAIENHAPAIAALKIIAGLWLAASAVSLWRNADRSVAMTRAAVEPGRVFVTTLLNPKALIFAFAIIPPGSPAAVTPWLLWFSVLVALVGAFWIFLGGALARSNGGILTPTLISRIAAVVLLVFGSALAGSAIAAAF
jgi:threonine/homoserine/homoserine lactone efflux protein